MHEASVREQQWFHAQQNYYEILLQRDVETRQYRHDMKNHLVNLETLMKQENIKEAAAYCNTLRDEIEKLSSLTYQTGNRMIDSLTNYLLHDVEEKAQITINGNIPATLTVNQKSLTTIYSNILQNAVDEVKRDETNQEKYIHISFQAGQMYMQLQIENSTGRHKIDTSHTNKKDAINHGYGLNNVKEELAQVNGQIEQKMEGAAFITTVIIPI